jgi:hypothetical protein
VRTTGLHLRAELSVRETVMVFVSFFVGVTVGVLLWFVAERIIRMD